MHQSENIKIKLITIINKFEKFIKKCGECDNNRKSPKKAVNAVCNNFKFFVLDVETVQFCSLLVLTKIQVHILQNSHLKRLLQTVALLEIEWWQCLRGLDTLVHFLPSFTWKTTFRLSVCFLVHLNPSETESSLKWKNLLRWEQILSW